MLRRQERESKHETPQGASTRDILLTFRHCRVRISAREWVVRRLCRDSQDPSPRLSRPLQHRKPRGLVRPWLLAELRHLGRLKAVPSRTKQSESCPQNGGGDDGKCVESCCRVSWF